MANWTLTGGLGSGKSIIAAGKLRDQLAKGLPAAGNMDFYPENALPPMNKSIYLRLPDFPSSDDLWSLGQASTTRSEKTFGLLVLDELAVFLNARDWQGKGRDNFIKYLRHVRKQHWHTLFITQDIESLDKQARIALIEHKAICSRTDRLPIPIIGWFLKLFGIAGVLPRVHIAIVRYGIGPNARKVDTWTYYGKSLFGSYNTDQIFTDDEERYIELTPYDIKPKKSLFKKPTLERKVFPAYVTGAFSTLSAWHIVGRYLSLYDRIKPMIHVFYFLSAIIVLCILFFTNPNIEKSINSNPVPVYEQAAGSMEVNNFKYLTTSTGKVVEVQYSRQFGKKTLYKADEQWFELSQ